MWSDVDDDLLALVLTPVKDPEKRKEAEVYVIIGDEVGDPGEHMVKWMLLNYCFKFQGVRGILEIVFSVIYSDLK